MSYMEKGEHKSRALKDNACLEYVQKSCKKAPVDTVLNWEVVLAYYTVHHLILSYCVKHQFYNFSKYEDLDNYLSQTGSGFPKTFYSQYKKLRNARRIAQYETYKKMPELFYDDAMKDFKLLFAGCSMLVRDC